MVCVAGLEEWHFTINPLHRRVLVYRCLCCHASRKSSFFFLFATDTKALAIYSLLAEPYLSLLHPTAGKPTSSFAPHILLRNTKATLACHSLFVLFLQWNKAYYRCASGRYHHHMVDMILQRNKVKNLKHPARQIWIQENHGHSLQNWDSQGRPSKLHFSTLNTSTYRLPEEPLHSVEFVFYLLEDLTVVQRNCRLIAGSQYTQRQSLAEQPLS